MRKQKIVTAKLQVITGSLLALAIFLAPVIAGAQTVSGQNTEPLSTEIDQYIREQMTQKNIVGMSVAIVNDKEITYLKGFGSASIEKQTQVTPQTIFDLASCSKSFTAMAVLLLWNDGKIDLDQTLKYYIPEFKLADEQASDAITVRELLNQTSGIPGNVTDPLAYHQGPNAMKDLVASMTRIHTDRDTASSFEYSNLNYALLGALAERVSGKSFDDFVEERIFTPLGMNNSTLKPEVAASLDRADGHQMMLGKVITRNTPIYQSAQPAGWVMSSAEDMGKWLIVNMNNGCLNNQQVIPAGVIEMMHTPGVDLIKDGDKASYAMGWFVGQTEKGEAVIWHGGDTSNFLSEMIILPDRKQGIVMLVNSQTSKNAHSIALGIAGMLMGSELKLPSSPWWASWAAIDQIALIAVILALILVLGLIPYLWWQWHIINRYQRREMAPPRVGKTMKLWLFVVPVTPWVFLAIISTLAYIVAQSLFGFNLFYTLIRFGTFAPPGVLIAAITILVSILLWMLALTITGFLRASVRARAEVKP
ncbi:MAG: serine hydrolase [Dehalococcoidales bacterium]|nr:serine hydrolase [Dehalococcoidales bacterium]